MNLKESLLYSRTAAHYIDNPDKVIKDGGIYEVVTKGNGFIKNQQSNLGYLEGLIDDPNRVLIPNSVSVNYVDSKVTISVTATLIKGNTYSAMILANKTVIGEYYSVTNISTLQNLEFDAKELGYPKVTPTFSCIITNQEYLRPQLPTPIIESITNIENSIRLLIKINKDYRYRTYSLKWTREDGSFYQEDGLIYNPKLGGIVSTLQSDFKYLSIKAY